MSMLTAHQLAASRHFEGPALTLAIPGSGKTTLLLHRLIYLADECDIPPEQILTLTFSKASAGDMRRRYDSLFADKYPYRFPFMTIHRFAYDILKQYLNGTGQKMQLLEDSRKKFAIIAELYRNRHQEPLTEDVYETLLNAFGRYYNLKLSESDVQAENGDQKNVKKTALDTYALFKAYHRYKKQHQLFDFDDMLLYAIKILDQNPKALAFFRNRFPFIQVDEAQDTSKLQFELIEKIAAPRHNLFLVADDDQSIYGFRGAYPQYLLDFPKRFKSASAYYLEDNFRSDAYIVDTAAGVIAENKVRYEKAMHAARPAVNPPAIHLFDDIIERNTFIADQLHTYSGSKAILYRNRISALSLIAALSDTVTDSFYIKDPPIQELSHWMIEDIKAFMTLAMIPQDLEAFKRIAFRTNGYISREMVNSVLNQISMRGALDRLIELPYLEDYQTRTLEGLKSRFEMLSRLRPYDAIHFIETDLGYLDYLRQNGERFGYTMQAIRTRLDAYKAIAKPLTSTVAFFSKLEALKETLVNLNQADAETTLSTIHGAKGLEFDTVFIIDINAHIFPSDDPGLLEEERRLFYVALTRAKDAVHLCHADFVNGGYNEASIFIDSVRRQDASETVSDSAEIKTASR
ncbi:ATP-dependent helicase [Fusibacter paucivorans]|uniref:DNA 3'-5' helicase n=1 Tax=Fusibacter paucivorans TaxID=76009 RepID=A0ABS5PK42_9FIRM|nr:ATP-dependent helicase [Fusibacter paucivorans]MBS7525520.1 ATP-dependent helicase [Fusibacter paucivorans]